MCSLELGTSHSYSFHHGVGYDFVYSFHDLKTFDVFCSWKISKKKRLQDVASMYWSLIKKLFNRRKNTSSHWVELIATQLNWLKDEYLHNEILWITWQRSGLKVGKVVLSNKMKNITKIRIRQHFEKRVKLWYHIYE